MVKEEEELALYEDEVHSFAKCCILVYICEIYKNKANVNGNLSVNSRVCFIE